MAAVSTRVDRNWEYLEYKEAADSFVGYLTFMVIASAMQTEPGFGWDEIGKSLVEIAPTKQDVDS
ncbi:MAG: hypothetical protein AAGG44_17150 [Planctomycetota bacterium]